MTPTTWADVKPGSTVTVKHIHRKRPFKFLVEQAHTITGASQRGYAFIYGKRLRMDGTPSAVRNNDSGGKLRRELVYLGDILELVKPPRSLNSDGRRARGTSNGNQRGGSAARRARKLWLLDHFGDGEKAECAFGCGTVVSLDTITVDRFPVPGCQGGTYARGNIRPACSACNSSRGAVLRRGK
jgi:hypothetical protein